ncbi:MAG: AAA family ATPase [Clostridiales bacterium]|nr:AAA family ATPase [Clostridiales bacterium]
MSVILTDEQELFIEKALGGENILVDACVGSGKTTAIQALCMRFPKDKRILYLTYNRLLKIDAKEKIKGANITVNNYHGYAWSCLHGVGTQAGVSDLLQEFNKKKPPVGTFDLIVLDEYQDIDQEIADMLDYIVGNNSGAQLVAVGDMKQKIYDKTALEAEEYIEKFLGKHVELEFTKCFRLPNEYARKLGRIWKKKIIGVNNECEISEMSEKEIVSFLADQEPSKLLCLGSREGTMAKVLNKLESKYEDRFNKNTVYASISDQDTLGKVQPSKETAIFTTFDSSKGLEREICVVFDFTESYWRVRVRKPWQRYEILRNIFLVAASRGKRRIIFVPGDEDILSEESISAPEDMNTSLEDVGISEMFDFKFQEDIEECYNLLEKKKINTEDHRIIDIRSNDGLIDLSPCIGIFQEAFFFEKYDIDREFELFRLIHGDRKLINDKIENVEKKILYLTSLETGQRRYYSQVSLPLVTQEQKELLLKRIEANFRHDEEEQIICRIPFAEKKNGKKAFEALGYADVIKKDTVYELKFVSQINHEHYLQCACYMIAQKMDRGVLWNTRTNEMWEISIPNRQKFMDSVAKTITKRQLTKYYKPKGKK